MIQTLTFHRMLVSSPNSSMPQFLNLQNRIIIATSEHYYERNAIHGTNPGSVAQDLVWVKFLANENWIAQSKLCVESVMEETAKFREFVASAFVIIWKSD